MAEMTTIQQELLLGVQQLLRTEFGRDFPLEKFHSNRRGNRENMYDDASCPKFVLDMVQAGMRDVAQGRQVYWWPDELRHRMNVFEQRVAMLKEPLIAADALDVFPKLLGRAAVGDYLDVRDNAVSPVPEQVLRVIGEMKFAKLSVLLNSSRKGLSKEDKGRLKSLALNMVNDPSCFEQIWGQDYVNFVQMLCSHFPDDKNSVVKALVDQFSSELTLERQITFLQRHQRSFDFHRHPAFKKMAQICKSSVGSSPLRQKVEKSVTDWRDPDGQFPGPDKRDAMISFLKSNKRTMNLSTFRNEQDAMAWIRKHFSVNMWGHQRYSKRFQVYAKVNKSGPTTTWLELVKFPKGTLPSELQQVLTEDRFLDQLDRLLQVPSDHDRKNVIVRDSKRQKRSR